MVGAAKVGESSEESVAVDIVNFEKMHALSHVGGENTFNNRRVRAAPGNDTILIPRV